MSRLSNELNKNTDLEYVKEIQFSVFNPDNIRNGSVCEVLTPDTYEGSIPKINGLFDYRMGTIDDAIICPTDENRSEMCPGYFGHINLAQPVYYYHFIPYVEKILKCVCFRCSNILIDKSDINVIRELENKKGSNRFLEIVSLSSKVKQCKHNKCCHVLQPNKYFKQSATQIKDKDNIIKIFAEFDQSAFNDPKAKKLQQITPEMCFRIFSKITDDNVNFLGFNHKYSRPEWMICSVLPVPPPSVRPSVRQDNNTRSEDDLTHALLPILKANKALKQKIEINAPKNIISGWQGCLQYNITTYMDNDIPGIPPSAQRSMRPLKSLAQRLKSKDGRIRGNIQGKRVDFSARTVISVDPNIKIDEFGVPKTIAMNLTFPEIVTKYNIVYLSNLVKAGPFNYPGAKSVTKKKENNNMTAYTISLKHVDLNSIILDIGDVVHRHLINGDIALFNRQPSLHRMSMMAHKIKVVPFNTFRLNVSVCTPYNADFDGDEMNMHMPQSYQTLEELKRITLVPTQIIDPGSSKPIITIVQDSLLGAYIMTLDDKNINKNIAFNLMMYSRSNKLLITK